MVSRFQKGWWTQIWEVSFLNCFSALILIHSVPQIMCEWLLHHPLNQTQTLERNIKKGAATILWRWHGMQHYIVHYYHIITRPHDVLMIFECLNIYIYIYIFVYLFISIFDRKEKLRVHELGNLGINYMAITSKMTFKCPRTHLLDVLEACVAYCQN